MKKSTIKKLVKIILDAGTAYTHYQIGKAKGEEIGRVKGEEIGKEKAENNKQPNIETVNNFFEDMKKADVLEHAMPLNTFMLMAKAMEAQQKEFDNAESKDFTKWDLLYLKNKGFGGLMGGKK